MRPHAMQMALVTSHVEALGKDGSTIALKNVITAQDAAAKTMEGMGQQRRPNGVTLLWGEEAWRWADGDAKYLHNVCPAHWRGA